jgi:hypothetical protein
VGDPTAANPYTSLTWTTTDPMKIWHIVYGAPDVATMAQATALSKTRGAGYIYVTDDVLSNPYDTLPPPDYWAAELATMAGAPGINKPPTRPAGLDTVEVYGTRVDLDWAGARGRAPVAAYDIYRDGVRSLVPGTTPKYSVSTSPKTPVFSVVAAMRGSVEPPSNPLPVVTDETLTIRKPVVGITTELIAHTSASYVAAERAPAAPGHRSHKPDLPDREIVRLPGGATSVTAGGLAPASTYNRSSPSTPPANGV